MEIINSKQFEMLIESIQLLAADYDIQIKVLPNFVHVTDEIALIFDDITPFFDTFFEDNLINMEIRGELDNLNRLLEQMSSKKELWNLTSLKVADEWQNIRSIAVRILKMFGKEKQVPNLFWLQFIPGSLNNNGL